MPIGIVTDADFESELSKISNPKSGSITRPSASCNDKPDVVPSIEIMDRPGRKDGDNNVPDALRKIIGEDALLNGRSSAIGLAKMFDISPSSVSAYTNGATSTASYNQPSSEIVKHINKSRARAIKKASKTLNGALGAITQEKLDYTDAKDLSVIAKNMSGIIKDLEPEKVQSDEAGLKTPQFVIFAPQFRDERSFEVIHVQE